MGAQLRAVRQRIRAIQSTAKITRAQELIAASRIIRAQQRVRQATPYASELQRAVEAVVSRTSNVDHPLVREPQRRERERAAGGGQAAGDAG
jgi:F-type H+-transporting ATPase subunit gamma